MVFSLVEIRRCEVAKRKSRRGRGANAHLAHTINFEIHVSIARIHISRPVLYLFIVLWQLLFAKN